MHLPVCLCNTHLLISAQAKCKGVTSKQGLYDSYPGESHNLVMETAMEYNTK